ncbi:MAG: hypothetical protein NTU95_07485 [Methanothrix sp.]|nr:hypothetical protein [Methanothrix sp.]
MEVLRTEGISVEKISTARPTLDDVFLKYAGTMHLTSSIDSKAMKGKESL